MNPSKVSTLTGVVLVLMSLASAAALVLILIVDDSDDRSSTFVASLVLAPTVILAVGALVGAYVIAAKTDREAIDQIALAGAALAGVFAVLWGLACAISSMIVDRGYDSWDAGDRLTGLTMSAVLVLAGLGALAVGAMSSGLRLAGLSTGQGAGPSMPQGPQGPQPPSYPPPSPPAG
jgi:hypothetical protein